MKIAIDIRHLTAKNPSGVGHYTMRLIHELKKLSPETEFILFSAGSEKALNNLPKFHGQNIRVVKKKMYNRILNLLLLLRIRTLESFMHDTPDLWFFPNVNIVHTKLPYAITAHDISFDFMPDVFTRKQRLWHKVARSKRLVRDAEAILSVSKSTKQDLIERWDVAESRIFVTPLGVTDDFQPKQQPHDKNFLRVYDIAYDYFLTLSTIEPRKNLESVIEAYSMWRARTNEKTHLVIAGADGWKTKTLYNLATKSQFANDIHFIGYVRDKHRCALLRHAKIFLFPSYWEGFGLPVLEAMASGTPTIASFMSSIPEVTGNTALLIDPYSPTDIVSAFEVLTDDNVKRKLSNLGMERAQKFTWKRTAEETFTAFKKINL